jgi:hypothetical protein
MCRFRKCARLFLMAATIAAAPAALGQESAVDEPELSVMGPGSQGAIVFDRGELEQLGLVSVKTSTPWNQGVVNFEGVPIERILTEAGVSGTTATVTALNDYSVEIPISDLARYGVILAVKRDGAYMPVDDQGPFFVIYPFDSDPALQGQPYHGRAVWQVKEILVE